MDGYVTSSTDGSVGGVTVMRSAEECRQTVEILSKYFADNEEDIATHVAISNGLRPDPAGDPSMERSVLGCLDKDGVVQAATVCFVRKIKASIKVVEIVWFGSREKGQGWGEKLFRGIVEAAKGVGTDAILTTSTNSALRFWLTRTNICIADAVLRNKDRIAIDVPAQLGFKLSPAPTSGIMERLYTSMVIRNRKGRIVGDFEGKPFYYCVNTSNHVWYILNPKLHIKSVVHKSRPEMLPVSAVAAAAPSGSAEKSSKKMNKKRRQRAAAAAARAVPAPLVLRPVSVHSDPLAAVDSLAQHFDETCSIATTDDGDEFPTPASTPSLPL